MGCHRAGIASCPDARVDALSHSVSILSFLWSALFDHAHCHFWENADMHSNLITYVFSEELIHQTTVTEDNVQHNFCLLSLLLIACIYLCYSWMPSRQLNFCVNLCL